MATEPFEWTSDGPEATLGFGVALGRSLVGGEVVALIGQLGAGKTHLVKGIAAGNAEDAPAEVTSPTFTLINEYPGRRRIHHVDAYRLGGSGDLLALGFDELIDDDAVVVIEWADRVRGALPADTLWIELTATGQTSRVLRVTAAGPLAERLLDALRTRSTV